MQRTISILISLLTSLLVLLVILVVLPVVFARLCWDLAGIISGEALERAMGEVSRRHATLWNHKVNN